MGVPEQHRRAAPERLGFGILTVSDSRTPETDSGGDLIADSVRAAGHGVAGRELAPDQIEAIRAAVDGLLAMEEVDLLVVTGGTGVGSRDCTVEAVRHRFEPELPGFGELFRWLSYEEIGAAAMLSRAAAGVIQDRPVFLLPGSPAACRLAMERLIVPEAGHLVGQLR